MAMDKDKPFESWAIVEVMGHKRLAGFVSEQAVGGASFIRVDVPEAEVPSLYGRDAGTPEKLAGFTQLLGAASIYAITPCTEEVAKRAVASFRARPVQHLDLSPPRALPAPATDEDGEAVETLDRPRGHDVNDDFEDDDDGEWDDRPGH
jgi:hypothetical protein